jgi:hypothetical protein
MRAFRAAILSLFIATAFVSGPPASAEERVSSINCSTPLRLYDGTYRTGASVSVYTRGLWVNLSVVDFNNKTSSYAVGACAVVLAAGTNGSGAHYPECLEAGCIENSMLSGWNNVISSVYLR